MATCFIFGAIGTSPGCRPRRGAGCSTDRNAR
jgi:hypothetical protein